MSWYKAKRQLLLQIAAKAIQQGFDDGRILPITVADFPEPCRRHRATFVTLSQNKQLRGCIGSLQAQRPLIVDIAENAYAAAFRDPRFAPLQKAEFEQTKIQLSILSPATAISFTSERNLLSQLQVGIDGLILEYHHQRGTFLPSVWTQLPKPKQFLNHLKQKAGLASSFWSDDIKVYRYSTETIE